jgi:hypothetical protein
VKWTPIVIAYLAHVPYGIAVGVAAQHATEVSRWATSVLRAPVAVTAVAVALGLIVWHQPYSSSSALDRGAAVAEGPSAIVLAGGLHPEWLRIPVGGCATVANEGTEPVSLSTGGTLATGASTEICNDAAGVHRIRVDDQPFSGGWLIVDPSLPRP